MKNQSNKYLSIIFTSILLWSCANSENGVTIYHVDKRDNIANVADMIVPIDNLPILSSACRFIITGDTLLINDYRSTDLQFTAYDIYTDKTIGRFGTYGNGPGEIANYGNSFYDPTTKSIYFPNSNQGKIMGFHIPSAIADSAALAFDRFPWDGTDVSIAFVAPTYINDSTVICTTFDFHHPTRATHVCKFNPIARTVTVIDSLGPEEKAYGISVASKRHNKIFCPDRQQDMIRIFDLDGNLLSRIYGPEYIDDVDKHHDFFTKTQICSDKVASVYTGLNSKITKESIIVFDLDGKYIKTLKFGMPIKSIAYHEKTGRLYLSTDGEPQFGYIDFKKALSR